MMQFANLIHIALPGSVPKQLRLLDKIFADTIQKIQTKMRIFAHRYIIT